MLNKKILAVAIATGFTMNAYAVQDLNASPADKAVVFAKELITAGSDVVVTNAGNILDIKSKVGFSIADGTSKYVRIVLTNAVFETAVVAGDLSSATNADAGFAISQGGAKGDNYVVIEVSATNGNDIQQTDTITLAVADLNISQSATTTVAYTLHDSAVNAVAGTNALASYSGAVAQVASITSGTFVDAKNSVATVDSQFIAFGFGASSGSDAISATVGLVGAIDTSKYLTGTGYKTTGVAVAAADLVTPAQNVTFTGDFSFGTWTLYDNATCTSNANDVPLTVNADEDGTDAEAIADVNAASYLCVTVNGTDAIEKGSYSVSLDTDELTDTIGKISYDTTSIEVPYLSTYSGVNQKFFLVNNGASDAVYTISFTTEDGVTATDKAKASGTVPKGEMLTIKATDIVTLAGATRTAATIEVEAKDEDISAATQTVNLSTGGTDTVVLND